MDDQHLAILNEIRENLATIGAQVAAIHAELEEFRPVLRLFKPGNGTSDVQRAGLIRGMRKAVRGG